MKVWAKGISLLLAAAIFAFAAFSPLPADEALAEGDVYEFTVWRAKNNYSMKYEFTGEDMISGYIMDKFGVKINYEGPTGDWRTAYSVMLASADMPECIRDLGTGSEYMQTIKLGYLLPLDNWIAQYDGYRSTYSQRQIDMMKVDGASYTLVNWGHYDGTISGGNAGWAVNDAIYETLGSPKLETLDDLYAYLTAVKEAGLTANNQPVIPLQSSTVGTYVGVLPLLYAAQGAGRSGSSISKMCYDENGELRFVMEDEALLNALIFANKLYSEGLMNTDFFVETKDQITEKLMLGRAAVYADTSLINVLGGTMSSLAAADDNSVHYTVIEPIAAEGVEQADVYTDAQSSLGSGGINITTAAEQPEKIFAFHDWEITPEGQYTIGFGPVGELWEYDQDGSPLLKEGKTLVLSSEELQKNPIYSFFTLGQSNLYNEAKLKFNRLLPEGERDWIIEAQDTVIFRHTKDATVFANVNTNANTAENDAYMQAQEAFQAAIVSMITASDEAQVRSIYADAMTEIEGMGFDGVLSVLQAKFDANSAILG